VRAIEAAELTGQRGVQAPPAATKLSELRNRIRTFVDIAAANGTAISVDELQTLQPPGTGLTSSALLRFLETDRVLAADVVTNQGEVAPRESASLLGQHRIQQDLARLRLGIAAGFSNSLVRSLRGIVMIAVSGSTAYDAAKETDDIDMFIVTSPGRLWSTLLIAMVRARIERLRRPHSPVLCFNRVVDLAECEAEFKDSRDPFIAREALALQPLIGGTIYRDLLSQSTWMKEAFPILYQRRVEGPLSETNKPSRRPSPLGAVFEGIAFLLLGSYLRLVGVKRNAWLRRRGRGRECFETVVRRSICAYESLLYEQLRFTYRQALQ
jgi:predicted nucleotidyltransferase